MADPLTSREAFAGVLAGLVVARSIVSKSARVSRDDLQASVPLNERPYVRRGIDALIEHGVLGAIGDDVCFTDEGRAFLAYVEDMQSLDDAAIAELPEDAHAGTVPLRSLMAQDSRLIPPKAIEDIQTLPGRLEAYHERRSGGGVLDRWTLAFALAAAACAALFFR